MILSLDTSTPRLSAAILDGPDTLTQLSRFSEQRHNEIIFPLLQELLAQANRTPRDIQALAVGLGPGSFTGVRVGIAVAMGLAQALQVPVLGVPTYLALAVGSGSPATLVLGDAQQGKVYAAFYAEQPAGWQAIWPERLALPEEIIPALPPEPFAVCGPMAGKIFPQISGCCPQAILSVEEKHWPDAGILARLASGAIASPLSGQLGRGGTLLTELAPIYLRRTQAEEQKLMQENTPSRSQVHGLQ